MPIFEYKCIVCHRLTEIIEPTQNTNGTTCEHCGYQALPVVSTPGCVIFKGSSGTGFEKVSNYHAAKQIFIDSIQRGEMTAAEMPDHFKE